MIAGTICRYLSIFSSGIGKGSGSLERVPSSASQHDSRVTLTSAKVDAQCGNIYTNGNCPEKDSAIVVVGCRRLGDLVETVSSLLQDKQIDKYSLYLSLGCIEAISKEDLIYSHVFSRFTILEYHDPPNFSQNSSSFLRIQLHYRFFLRELFEIRHHRRVLILEDDLSLSPSLLHFFESTSPLFEEDRSIACISAFNDHALADKANSTVLRRTASFPNLALMFSDRTYSVLWKDQPLDITTNGWDHWLRIRVASLHMECVYPAVPRVRHRSTRNSTTASDTLSKKLAKYPMVTEDAVDLGDISYIKDDAYDRFLLSQFLEPQQVDIAVDLLRKDSWRFLGSHESIPSFTPEYQSDVVVMVGGVDKATRVRLMKGKKVVFFVLREVGVGQSSDR